jgi:Protein of unknown function (DUF2516)
MQGFTNLLSLLNWALIIFSGFALVDAALRREDAYRAVGKQTKPFWLIVLGLAFVVNWIFGILSFLPIIGLIATIVYMVDVRPAMRSLPSGGRIGINRRGPGGGRGSRGSSSDGPYGPFNGH